MPITYRSVNVYIDIYDNLIAIPAGNSEKYGLVDLDIIFQLNSPYRDEQIELFLNKAIEKSYSQKADDSYKQSSLERYLKINGFSKAVKNRRVVVFNWLMNSGYAIIPTNKVPREGYTYMEGHTIKLGADLKKGELAKAFREAMQLSTTY